MKTVGKIQKNSALVLTKTELLKMGVDLDEYVIKFVRDNKKIEIYKPETKEDLALVENHKLKTTNTEE